MVDYRETFRDKNGVIWAITDYGLQRLNPRQRQRHRAAQRRRWLLIGAGLIVLNLVLICLIGYTMLEVHHG